MTERIWFGILESERYYRYYHGLSEKMRRRQILLDWVLVVSGSGIIVALVVPFLQGNTLASALVLITAAGGSIGIYQQIKGYGIKATSAAMLSQQYKALGSDWRRMWDRRGFDDDFTLVLLAVLEERLNSIASNVDLPYDEAISIKSEDDANMEVIGEFATAA